MQQVQDIVARYRPHSSSLGTATRRQARSGGLSHVDMRLSWLKKNGLWYSALQFSIQL